MSNTMFLQNTQGNVFVGGATGAIYKPVSLSFLTNVDPNDISSLEAVGCSSLSGGGSNSGTVTAYTAQQYFAQQTLTDGATINWNLNTQQAATVTLGGNRTLANPSNMEAGATYTLIVKQDGTGSRTLAYGANYYWPGGTAPTLSAGAGAIDIITFLSDGTNMYGLAQLNFQA
jgi:hypothetical protein